MPKKGAGERGIFQRDFRPQDTGAGQPLGTLSRFTATMCPLPSSRTPKKWHKTLTSLCTVFGGIFLVAGLAGLADIIDLWGYWV